MPGQTKPLRTRRRAPLQIDLFAEGREALLGKLFCPISASRAEESVVCLYVLGRRL